MNFFTKYASLASLCLMSSLSFGVEPAEGWYAGFLLGANAARSDHFTLTNPFTGIDVPGSIKYNIGGNVGANLGFRCNKFRYEAEIDFNLANAKQLTVGPIYFSTKQANNNISFKSKNDIIAGLFNVYYEFYDEENSDTFLVPYLGLGLGYAHINNKIDFLYNGVKVNSLHASKSADGPIGQAILGLNYFFTDNVSLGTDFRYLGTQNIKEFDSRLNLFSWNLLMGFSFDSPAY